jgi:hypothetical protein
MSLMDENCQMKIYNINLIKQNDFLNNRISQLENINKYKQNKNQKSLNVGTKEEILRLNNKINHYELLVSKLNMEKKILESKLINLKKDFNNEINLVNNLKNNELQSYQKRINEMKKNEFKNITDLNMSKKMFALKRQEDSKFYIDKINILEEKNDKLLNDNFALDEENKKLKNIIQNNNLNMKYKDNIIKSLNEKIKSISNNYKNLIESLEKNNDQSQFQVKQLFIDNDKYKQENQMLTIEMNKLRESFADYNNKMVENNQIMQNYRNKLNEYKIKIIVLKQRINELLNKNNQHRINSEYNNLMKYKSSMNFFKP